MVNAQILFDSNGPLPLKTTFNAPADGSVMFVITGTAYTQTADNVIGVTLSIDGVQIGAAAMGFANDINDHAALRPSFIMFDSLTFGEHTLLLEPYDASTVTDQNDYFQIVLFY